MKKKLALILALVMIVSIFSGCGAKETAAPQPEVQQETQPEVQLEAQAGEKKTVVLTVMNTADAWFQAIVDAWELIAEENDFELIVMDPAFDATALETIIEDIIAMEPDGVVYAPLNNEVGTKHCTALKEAGIPTLAYNVTLSETVVPNVINGNYSGSVLLGEYAAKVWQEKHPDVAPVIGMLNLFGVIEGDQRCDGFVDGFKSVYPEVEVAVVLDGKGARDVSLSVTEDMLQANPEVNVIYGINDSSSLGALDALKEAGKGTIDQALVCSTDGSEAGIIEMLDENSAFKCVVGNPPKGMAEKCWDVLKMVWEGTATTDSLYESSFILVYPDTAETWLSEQYNIG